MEHEVELNEEQLEIKELKKKQLKKEKPKKKQFTKEKPKKKQFEIEELNKKQLEIEELNKKQSEIEEQKKEQSEIEEQKKKQLEIEELKKKQLEIEELNQKLLEIEKQKKEQFEIEELKQKLLKIEKQKKEQLEMEEQKKEQLEMVNRMVDLSKRYRIPDGTYIDILNIKNSLEKDINLEDYYENAVKNYFDQNKNFPNIPIDQSIIEEFQHRNLTLALNRKEFINPLNFKERIDLIDKSNEEINEIVKRYNEYRLGLSSEGYVANLSLITAKRPIDIVISEADNPTKDETENPPKINITPGKETKKKRKTINFTTMDFLKRFHAHNPNTNLPYYYLKLRDIMRINRRLMNFTKLFEGNEKDYTFIKLENDEESGNKKAIVNHTYSIKHDKSIYEKNRLLHYMNMHKNQSILFDY